MCQKAAHLHCVDRGVGEIQCDFLSNTNGRGVLGVFLEFILGFSCSIFVPAPSLTLLRQLGEWWSHFAFKLSILFSLFLPLPRPVSCCLNACLPSAALHCCIFDLLYSSSNLYQLVVTSPLALAPCGTNCLWLFSVMQSHCSVLLLLFLFGVLLFLVAY